MACSGREVWATLGASSESWKTLLPRVRIELTTFRWLVFCDYETDALPTALPRQVPCGRASGKGCAKRAGRKVFASAL